MTMPSPNSPTADMPLTAHLRELRNRLVLAFGVVLVGMIGCYIFKEPLFNFLVSPLTKYHSGQLIFTGVPELFFTYLKMSFLGGLYIGFPVLLWEIWRFTAPGLYQQEKKVMAPLLFITPFLFYVGGVFTWVIVMPVVTQFFLGFQTETIVALPSVKEYLSFFLKMIFAFGIAFELPVLLLLLVRAGIFTSEQLARGRRYAIVLIFIAAAILTPPDPASQLLLALPMVLLYELSILLSRFFVK